MLKNIKLRIGAILTALAMVCCSVSGITKVKAIGSAMLTFATDGDVVLDGSSAGQVKVSLTASQAEKLYTAQGKFATTEKDDTKQYFTVNSLDYSVAISTYNQDNNTSTGEFYYKYAAAGDGVEFSAGAPIYVMTYDVKADTPAGTYHLPISVEYVQQESIDDYEEEVEVDATVTVVREESTPAVKPSQVVTFRDGEGNPITEITKQYGDDDFVITKEVTTGDGEISDYHPDDDGTGKIAHTIPNTDLVGVGVVGDVDICAWVSETDTYAETKACYTVHVKKKTISLMKAEVEDKVYDGTNAATVKEVALSDESLVLGRDYDVNEVYFPNYDAGRHDDVYFKVRLDEDLWDRYQFNTGGAKSTLADVTATITAFELTSENMTAVLSQTEYYYSGNENKPTVTVTVDLDGDGTKETALVLDTDFTVSYPDDTVSVGGKTMVINGKGNYSGRFGGLVYNVLAQSVEDVEINVTNQTYTGEVLAPVFTATGVINGERVELTEGVHYDVIEHDAFVNAGSYQFGIASSYNSNYYTPITNATFVINAHALASSDVTLEYTTTKYNGSEKKPSVTVKIGNFVVASSEYEVTYAGDTLGSVDADATPMVKITAKEGANISGSVELNYTITANNEYDVVRGGGQAYVFNSNSAAEFEIDADYSLFEVGGSVYVDEMLVDSSNYDSWSSSTVISLKPEFMKTLALSEHKLKVLFNNGGAAETTFTISEQEPEAPRAADTGVFTGVDGGAVTVAGIVVLGVMVLAGALYVIVDRKSKRM